MSDLRQAWYVGAALVALGRLDAEQLGRAYKRVDLEQVCADFKGKRSTTTRAIEHLGVLGFMRRSTEPQQPGRPSYVLTPEGIAAARAAASASERNAQAAEDPFARRLWALLRARAQLTPPEAAEVLADAGDGDAELVRDRAARWLLSWSRCNPQAIQLSAKRVRGAKRYVLVKDLGPHVPQVCSAGGTAR